MQCLKLILGVQWIFQILNRRWRIFGSLVDVGGYPRSLMDASGYFISVEFGGIVRSVESSGFLRYRVDISGNLRLSGFFKFWFKVRAVYYRVFLLIIGGGK